MTKSISLLTILFTAALCSLLAQPTSKNTSTPTKPETMTTNSSTEPVKLFFNAFGNGDFNGILNSFHENCSITAVRAATRSENQLYGTYTGKQGVTDFITNLGNTFNTKAFTVDYVVGEGNVAFACGKFTHEIKATGKLFSSDWSLMCVIKDNTILEFHFYEDSASFVVANTK